MKKRFNINLDDSAFSKERIPPKQQFQPSSKAGQANPTSAASGGTSAPQPLSYAEYIIQNKNKVQAPAPQRDVCPQPKTHDLKETVGLEQRVAEAVQTGDDDLTSEKVIASGMDVAKKTGEAKVAGADVKDGQKSDPCLAPKPVGFGSSIIVSPRQRGNPILKFVRSVPWEFGEVVPDYVLGQTTCALFLSLRYHNLNPNYIHDRLKQLGQTFTLRVLLVQVDVKDPHHALKELARICIMADCTLILAWSPEEAGRYLETYKSYEKKPADLLKEQVEKDYLSKVTDCLTTVKSINKTDAITLLSTFSSIDGIMSASKEDLVLCPGLGPQKARRLHDVLHKPFLKSKTKDS
ncbi:DNA excision repair protein ERCC-1 [Neosynchiropus ocellatus]